MAAPQLDQPSARKDRRLLFAAAGLFVASRLILLASPPPGLSDVRLYCNYALQGVDFGRVAYRDYTIEYPPLAWGLIALPRLLATERCPETPDDAQVAYRDEYRRVYRGLMFLVDIAALAVFWHIAGRRYPARRGALCLSYVAVTTSSLYLLYDRLDVGLSLLLLLWALAWLRSLEDQSSANARRIAMWRIASYVALGLSVAYKVIPIIILPFLLLADWQARPRVRVWPGMVAFVAALVIPFLVLLPSAGTTTLRFIEYHGQRGIQVESLYAAMLFASTPLGIETKIVAFRGADEVAGEWVPAMKTLASMLMGGFLACTGLWCLVQGRRFDRQQAWRCAVMVVLGSVALSPVLSPQYFVWALPLALLVGAELLPAGGRAWPGFAAGVVVIAVLTTLIFPCAYFGLVNKLQPDEDRRLILVAGALVALRDAAYLALVVWLGSYVFRSQQLKSDRQFSSGGTLP